jgi:malate synthase
MQAADTGLPDTGDREPIAGLQVDVGLAAFLRDEALPGSGITEARFWAAAADLVDATADRHRALLGRRTELQAAIDGWHRDHPGPVTGPAYREFLTAIGYLHPTGAPVSLHTDGIDPEVAEVAAPQLVVPLSNARYVLNAANARWGSLYDALYGTDALGDAPPGGPFDQERGDRVVAWARDFLDRTLPLEGASHHRVTGFRVTGAGLDLLLDGAGRTRLSDPAAFAGYRGPPGAPVALLFVHHGLHLELLVDPDHPVGRRDRAGVADVVLEAAATVIMDAEDSVAAVDSADKVGVYRTWLGLMLGTLEEEVTKEGTTFTRSLAPGRTWLDPGGAPMVLPGRALMLIRNVGLHMETDAVLDRHGHPVPEGLLDAMVTVLCARHDLARPAPLRNSPAGSVYLVKPKLHGPDEVAFFDEVLERVEDALDVPRHTVKVGLMDEERRTSLNLEACIGAAASRLAFINTGFLDRTGDEIHTSMQAGPMVRKGDMRGERWLAAYERNNMEVGLACGLRGRAQIGKGMWAAPDRMHAMLEEKVAQLEAGASCAWVPSPTAATLHAVHYHRVDVAAVQQRLAGEAPVDRLDDLLSVPVVGRASWDEAEVAAELDNNLQGILGYVVRWVELGIGCSKVPDIHDVALMEDRATCRISSQHVANWLLHGVVTDDQVSGALRRMAALVDDQNAGDPAYVPLAPAFDSPAARAAADLVFQGVSQPGGYTEPVLHAHRRQQKHHDHQRPVHQEQP